MFGFQGSLELEFSSEGAEMIDESMQKSAPTILSLYSGAGGMDLGFTDAGFQVKWAIDFNADAVSTYNANLDPVAVCGDVLSVDPPDDISVDVVVGGPPCQGFSVIGRMDPDDPRSRHVSHFFDVVERIGPRAFVMENVKALATHSRWQELRETLIERASNLGYNVELFVLNAKDYAVPQSRERMFLIGIEDAVPMRPSPTTDQSPVTVRQALATLPRVGEHGNDAECTAKIVPARSPIMRASPYNGSLLFNGSGRPLDLDQPAKTLPASMGGNATPILDQHEIDTDAKPWVVGYHRQLAQGANPSDRVPDRLRRITVQEAAALQSFPADWEFIGARNSRFRQIGNAVPPRLAFAVANELRDLLAEAAEPRARELAAAA